MSTMKAIVIEQTGGTDKLIYKDVPVPKAEKDTVIIKNHFAGVNFIDTYHRTGLYPLSLPFVLGRESAGEVSEVGDNVTDFKVGDRVVCLGADTYAEYTRANISSVEKITSDVSYETAAAIGIQGMTAWTMVQDAYNVKKGDYILVHAAAGGVGLLLCQMCHYLGANVIGTVSSAEKAALARQNGADYVINYTSEDVKEKVNEITNGLGCHAVLDGVGKSTFDISLACTRRLGTLISFGNASGVVPPIAISILTAKNVKLMRPTLFNYLITREESKKWWGGLFDLLKKGHIKTHIHKVYDLKDASQAHIDIESRKTTGKLLLKI
ncbi:NADPH:quinone reductase [Apophysomyces sp. BC1034]|nr:NADPH:quinone reductase [Apophysomyces sp. BC1015]KAG0176365.1 NADPH:quinone reductase [Apophysomyces sp. BC1021]KAG0187347.1 NADPH:quinone reductase [Apophysomyces sp. BC1034]